ncbi:hypothetical protein HJC23_003796 [Cyclotella cryptica]|uniref:Uncharacterized protein n=1 Tax=Cyclotella cryptica TaxID=29204 RepID=A0ABD3PZZ1_9STRA
MSIYAESSETYWKERQKKPNKKSPFGIAGVVLLILLALAGSVLYVKNTRGSTPPSYGAITQRRSLLEATQSQWKECESRVDSRQECTSICLPERNSIQRKTMHQACLHGCQQAHVASTSLGCRGKADGSKTRQNTDLTEEDVFEVVGVLAYSHCAKFQGVDPKPDAFATCRKYHRAGTKQGFRMGKEAMKKVLDEEWAALKMEP